MRSPSVLRLTALALVGLAGCSSDAPAPQTSVPAMRIEPAIDTAAMLALTPDQKADRVTMAEESVTSYRTADGERRLSEACAEANAAAMFYGEAGRPADAARWQVTADSSCAAMEPEIERTLARLTDSLAAARGD